MITVVDYGVGNLFSLKSSFDFLGEKIDVCGDVKTIEKAEKIILPGVGAFRDAAEKLNKSSIAEVIKSRAADGVPIMGICLGMQLLFDESKEFGINKGLSLIKGVVEPIKGVIPTEYKIPHIGWNALDIKPPNHPIFKYIEQGDYVYFVHSFYAVAEDNNDVIAQTEYGAHLTAAVAHGNVCGCQFHPEKSGDVGMRILKGFCEWESKK